MVYNEEQAKKILKNEMLCFMIDAEKAKEMIFSNTSDKILKCLAILTRASNHLAYAKSVYQFGIDDKRETIDEVFHAADVFINEITTNISTDHSHQWTSIEFTNLAKKYDCSELFNNQKFNV